MFDKAYFDQKVLDLQEVASKVAFQIDAFQNDAFQSVISKILEGILASTGALRRSTYKTLAGAITSAGDLLKSKITFQAIGGVLNFAGVVATSVIVIVSVLVGGALILAGDVTKTTFKFISGVLSLIGKLPFARFMWHRISILSRSKTKMTVQTTSKSRITIHLRGGG